MIGDKLVITAYHEENGKKVADFVLKKLKDEKIDILAVTVSGESGCGKSETAYTTCKQLEKAGIKTIIIGQDDYFKIPPKSNSKKRKEDISRVGIKEVNIDLMDENIKSVKNHEPEITKPLVYFDDDKIGEETLSIKDIKVIIAEGTYTATLSNADVRAFIDSNYHMTLQHRKKRARDEAEGEFIEHVLEIEHQIISKHKELADIILPPETKNTN